MRSCKGCTLCCELLGITEIDKPAFTKCWNQNHTGCSVYDHRPPSCRQFDCAWRLGHVPKHLRPSTTGAVITSNGQMIMIYVNEMPVHPRALKQLTGYASSGIPTIVACKDRRWQMTKLGTLQEILQTEPEVDTPLQATADAGSPGDSDPTG